MKFSVLINNHNYARFLPEAVASAAAQTRPPHEIIVVDDGSTDDSLAVLAELQKQHPALRVHAQPNGGQLSALRAGVGLAGGDWCCFLDADDSWEPGHLAGLAETLAAHPDLDAIYAGHRETEGPPLFRFEWPAGRSGPHTALVAAFRMRIGPVTSAIALRGGLARAVLDLDPALDADWRVRADDCLVFGASYHGALIFHRPEPTVRYRIHGANAYAHRDRRLAAYRDRFRLARLCAAHAARVGVYERELPAHLAREMKLPDNRHPRVRARYRRAVWRLPAGLGARLALWLKSFR